MIATDIRYPSILKQTEWKCGFFHFGKAEQSGIAYFNPGLVSRPDGQWLVTRRSESRRDMTIGMNSLMAFKLDKNHAPMYGKGIRMKSLFANEHFEDARAVYNPENGLTYVSCCNFIVFPGQIQRWTGAHITLQLCNNEWDSLKRVDPVYGNNRDTIAATSGLEKNWLFFFHQKQLHLVYQAQPHTVVRWSEDFKSAGQFVSDNSPMAWAYGEIRGGTPPVFVDGLYWSFFHSSLKLENKYHRRYYMGAYAFEPYPPFRIVRFTREPLLAGSDEDVWSEKKPLVVFPCGSSFENDVWFITMGVNDLASAWIEIPHADLIKRTQSINARTSIPKVFEVRPKLKDVTLICVDDNNVKLAEKAISECTRHVSFADVKLLTSDKNAKHSVAVPPVRSLEDYSRFLIKDLLPHVKTSHCLITQWDGFIIDPSKWSNSFLEYDYIGSPWKEDGVVGNGGFSLRSKKLLSSLQSREFDGPFQPEDAYICRVHRDALEKKYAIRFATPDIAKIFSVENSAYSGQFGFHSFLTKLPTGVNRPAIFHHSGDYGDMVYGMAAVRALGGGILFCSPTHRWQTRQVMTEDLFSNISPLLNNQTYIAKAQFTGELPASVDFDLNDFRLYYDTGKRVRHESLFSMQLRAAGAEWPEDKPWMSVDFPIHVGEHDVVVSRSLRYQNDAFPWQQIVDGLKKRIVFIGTDVEYSEFIRAFGYVARLHTSNLLDVARAIAGCSFFIGNQSCPMAIALGLGANLVQEVWPDDSNCILKRSNAVYCRDGKLEIPWI